MFFISDRAPLRSIGWVWAALFALLPAAMVVFVATAAGSTGAAAPAKQSVKVPARVTGSLIKRPPQALRPGTVVPSSSLGLRVFPKAKHGFALAKSQSLGGAQYPAATQDGGATWTIAGPPLQVNAAQAPLVVTQVGARGARTCTGPSSATRSWRS